MAGSGSSVMITGSSLYSRAETTQALRPSNFKCKLVLYNRLSHMPLVCAVLIIDNGSMFQSHPSGIGSFVGGVLGDKRSAGDGLAGFLSSEARGRSAQQKAMLQSTIY